MAGARARRVCGAILIAVAMASPASAAEPLSPAGRLHEAAVKAHQAGRLRQAIELWRDALKLEPSWKYAYNLANTQYLVGDGEDAWDNLRRADELSPPEEYIGIVAELRSKVRALLYRDHAWLVLEVVPAEASVKRDGVRWAPPHDAWLRSGESRIEVRADGYLPYDRAVSHPIGDRSEVRIVLEKEPAVVTPDTGTLRVDGTPIGATVTVAGRARGELPIEGIELPPGRVEVVVRHPGFGDQVQTADIAAGRETRLKVELGALPPPEEPNNLATPGWMTVIGGAVLLGAGTGFHIWASSTRDEIDALNSDTDELARLGYAGYDKRYDDLKGSLEDRRLASQLFFVAGGAAVVTGTVLLLLDDGGRAPDGSVHLVPLSGGGALIGSKSF